MKWLMRLLNRQQPANPPSQHDIFQSAPDIDEKERAYQSEKLAAVEAEVERMAQLRRLGYDFDVATRQDSDADH